MIRPQSRLSTPALVIALLVLAILAVALLKMPLVGLTLSLLAVGAGALGAYRLWPRRPCEAHTLAEATLNAMADAVIRFDLHGRLQYLNPAATRLIGLPTEAAAEHVLDEALQLIEHDERSPILPRLFDDLRQGYYSSLGGQACLLTNEGLELEVEGECAPILADTGEPLAGVLVLRDVTEARAQQRRQAWLAEHDALTGTLNRKAFEERLARSINSKRASEYPMTLLHLEIDAHAGVTESGGQAAGEELLVQTVRLIQTRVRDTDPIGRLDEATFGVLLPACPDEIAQRIARTIHDYLAAHRFEWEGRSHELKPSLGIVPVPPNWETLDRVLSAGHAACAASRDRGTVAVFED